MPGWLTPGRVAGHVQVDGVTDTSEPLINACAAAERWVETSARPDLDWTTAGFPVPADVLLGGLMLAWRWYQRRSSPMGVTLSPSGDPIEVLRHDPDIARLLGVGSSGGFVFGSGTIPTAEELA